MNKKFKSFLSEITKSLDIKEDVEQVDELSKKTKDAYIAKRGSQLSSMMYGSGKNYNSLTGKKQANAVKGIKKAMSVKEDIQTPERDTQMTKALIRLGGEHSGTSTAIKKQQKKQASTYSRDRIERQSSNL